MVDGLLNKKVVFIIQARMLSTRLPGKILMPLPLGSNKPILTWIIEELKKSTFYGKIVIATSKSPENDILVKYSDNNGVSCFRGDENNVLSRFISVVKGNDFDIVVRLTGDNPIIDVNALDTTIKKHIAEANDYTRTDGFPVGMNFEVISAKALASLENEPTSESDKEHVTSYIRNSHKFISGIYALPIKDKISNLRLTIDYPSDFALVGSILSQCDEQLGNLRGLPLIEHTYSKFPWLFETNAPNIQKKHFNDVQEELKEAVKLLRNLDFNNAADLLNDK